MAALKMPLMARIDERTRRVVLTAGAVYAGRFGMAISLLITIPIARQSLGPNLFGVWMLLSTMLSFFAFADFGVGNVVLNRVTAARAAGDTTQTDRAIAGGYVCTAIAGLAILLAWFAWCALAEDPASVAGHLSASDRPQVMAALHIFVVLLALNLPASLIQKVQLGSQQGHWMGASQLAASLATLVAVPTVFSFGGGLPALVLSSLGILVFVNLASTVLWLIRDRTAGAPHWNRIDRSMVVSLFKAGTPFLAIQLASAFAFQSDAIVITQLLGQAPYGEYAAVQRLFVFASMLISAALVGLWPAFGDALARGEITWVRRALKRALGMSLLVIGCLCLFLAVSMGWITKAWLGTPQAPTLLLTSLFSLWAMIEALGMVVGSLLNGAGMLRAQAILALAMAVISFFGKWFLVSKIGVEGAVMATLFAYCSISVPAQLILLRNLFRDAQRKADSLI
ncbi:MAG: oligosaccharide flippase family protein [Betaproteobacteria bacterium]